MVNSTNRFKDIKHDKYILAVDHGTSGIKNAIISVYGKLIDYEFAETPLYLLPNGGAEQKTEEWWEAFIKTAKTLIERNKDISKKIEAICVSGQWGCTIAIDKDANSLYNVISWMDSRGAPYIQEAMKGKIFSILGYGISNILKWVPTTGGAPLYSGKDPIAHILYIKNELPDIYNKTYKFLDSKDYMNLRLTGKFAATYDSIHLHWLTNSKNIHNIHYEDKLIKHLDIDKNKLPDLIKSTDILGMLKENVAKQIGLTSKVKVIGGSGDLQMAAIGSGAVDDFHSHIYIGTSAFLICHVPYMKTDIFHNIASLPSANPDKYFVASEQDNAGNCLNFLLNNIINFNKDKSKSELTDYKSLDDITVKVPAGSNNLIFTPWLYGERTPIEDHTIRGGFHNLSLNNNLNDMIRAVFEGVAFNAKWVIKYIEKFVKTELNPINIIGGGANSDIWCQIYADILDRTIKRVEDPIQGNSKGAAFVAAVGLNYISFDEIPKLTKFTGTFKPNPENRQVYDKMFKEFVNIYKRTKKICKNLNQYS